MDVSHSGIFIIAKVPRSSQLSQDDKQIGHSILDKNILSRIISSHDKLL